MRLPGILTLSLLIGIVLVSCKASTGGTSMIVGDRYEEKKNETILTILPYGAIVIPGKWTKTHYDATSRQHNFRSEDSTTLMVAKNPKEKFSFYSKDFTDKQFVNAFVDWETEYYNKQGFTSTRLVDQSDKGYILWRIEKADENVNTIILYGTKNGFAYGFVVPATRWNEEKIKTFLVDLFHSN